MYEAMSDWRSKTGNKVRFYRYPDWLISWGWLFGGMLRVELRHMSINGYATVGYTGGDHVLKINRNILGQPDKLKRTTRHELGHVLGLLHEHQRWDRDEYLDMRGDTHGNNNKKINLYSKWGFHFFRFERRVWHFRYLSCRVSRWRLRCGWRTYAFYYWVPVWAYHEFKDRTGRSSGAFDCKSIMLYPYIHVRGNKCGTDAEYGMTINNTEISHQDAQAVRSKY